MSDTLERLNVIESALERLRKSDANLGRGTSFPTSPATGLLFFRTDLNLLCVYDGAQWVTAHELSVVITYSTDLTATYSATTSAIRRGLARDARKASFTRGEVYINLGGGTSNSSNFWTVDVVAADLPTTIWSFDTKTDSASANTLHTTTSFTQPGSATALFRIDVTKTLTPPNISILGAVLFYREVVT